MSCSSEDSLFADQPSQEEDWESSSSSDDDAVDAVAEFCQKCGRSEEDAKWYLKADDGDLQLAVSHFHAVMEFCNAFDCSENVAWSALNQGEWDPDRAAANMSLLRKFCDINSCNEYVAWSFLKSAAWNMEDAIQEFSLKDCIYQIACPYKQHGDCDLVWSIPRAHLNCRVARCGINIWRGQVYQFPKHGSRKRILDQTQSWSGQHWEGWPGEVYGCGRPFGFPNVETLKMGEENVGIFMSWDDQTEGTIHDVLAADSTGDYSPVVSDNVLDDKVSLAMLSMNDPLRLSEACAKDAARQLVKLKPSQRRPASWEKLVAFLRRRTHGMDVYIGLGDLCRSMLEAVPQCHSLIEQFTTLGLPTCEQDDARSTGEDLSSFARIVSSCGVRAATAVMRDPTWFTSLSLAARVDWLRAHARKRVRLEGAEIKSTLEKFGLIVPGCGGARADIISYDDDLLAALAMRPSKNVIRLGAAKAETRVSTIHVKVTLGKGQAARNRVAALRPLRDFASRCWDATLEAQGYSGRAKSSNAHCRPLENHRTEQILHVEAQILGINRAEERTLRTALAEHIDKAVAPTSCAPIEPGRYLTDVELAVLEDRLHCHILRQPGNQLCVQCYDTSSYRVGSIVEMVAGKEAPVQILQRDLFSKPPLHKSKRIARLMKADLYEYHIDAVVAGTNDAVLLLAHRREDDAATNGAVPVVYAWPNAWLLNDVRAMSLASIAADITLFKAEMRTIVFDSSIRSSEMSDAEEIAARVLEDENQQLERAESVTVTNQLHYEDVLKTKATHWTTRSVPHWRAGWAAPPKNKHADEIRRRRVRERRQTLQRKQMRDERHAQLTKTLSSGTSRTISTVSETSLQTSGTSMTMSTVSRVRRW